MDTRQQMAHIATHDDIRRIRGGQTQVFAGGRVLDVAEKFERAAPWQSRIGFAG